MTVLTISKQYKQRPSEIIGLTNDYEAFCFDEACIYIISKLQEEGSPKPKFIDDEDRNKTNNNDVIEWLNANNK
ncbi:hypothetical protein [Clostridium tetani]|uniref:Phage protein n=1 Tax=Clostridium tetani TaxID=1513 RepID=A0ABY0ELX5_CLOTA|nr:hypothetical protein [Clostridium tetani]RXI52677.1 hypothetical protein DP131_12235 [Clostridium tetani]RXI68599.1 hypothetical protein DQN76_10100 [Clostridium tetani]